METGTIFDLYVPKEQREEQPQAPERTRTQQSIRETGLGIAQGAGDLAQIVGVLEDVMMYPVNKSLGVDTNEMYQGSPVSQGQEARYKALMQDDLTPIQQWALMDEDDDLIPMMSVPGGRRALDESLAAIPEEGLLQEGVRRLTRSVPGLVAGPAVAAGMAGRDLLGMAGKESAKAMGAGEGVQTAADLIASLTPFPKKAILAGNKIIKAAETGTFTTQKEMVDFGRRMGMTEQEIAPLARDGWFSNVLEWASPRRGAAQKATHRTRAATGRNFDKLRELPVAQQELTGASKAKFLKELDTKLYDKIPVGAREAIAGDVKWLQEGPLTGDRMMEFHSRINDYYKQWPKLGAVKGPVKDALASLSPELAKDFNIANTMSQRGREVASKLLPNRGTDAFGATEAAGALYALGTFNYPALGAIAGTAGGRKLAQMMITNPRYHNLMKKMVTTWNAGQTKAGMKILDQVIGMIQKESPEVAAVFQSISEDEYKEMLRLYHEEPVDE